MDRPALQRLLAEVAAGRVDIVVVYKIDRLTRSLTDFAKIVEILDARGASFVSVTQQFNTTTSMGRLTLNMLLSFAQFEREIAGERIRDKIAASKKKGMWTGGNVPDPLYRATFPTMCLERDTDREIATTKRGKRIATSVDGTLTGLGGNLIVIDDPLKLGDAMSEAVRARVVEWYRSTLLSRGDDKTTTRIVVVMQRVHQNDLVGYLQEQGGFDVLNLPAIAQRPQTYDLGGGRTYTRQYGELLHPEHEPAHVLIELKWAQSPFQHSTSRLPSRPAARSSKENGSRPTMRLLLSRATASS